MTNPLDLQELPDPEIEAPKTALSCISLPSIMEH